MKKVAFLGLGAMGSRMAKHILTAGFELTVWNRTAATANDLVATGAKLAQTPREAAAGADIVIGMLTDDVGSKQVWTDPSNGALAGMKAGAVAVEASTLTPAWIAELSKLAEQASVQLLDAPVSGSRPQADAAQLVVMVGGTTEAFELAKDVLATTGTVHHIGVSGQGAVLKLAVNALLGIQIAGWAEMLGFLQKNGMELSAALQVLTTMPVCSPAAAGMAKLMLAHDFAPRFTNALIAKDFNYVQQTAEKLGSKTPISEAASAVFATASETMAEENVTAVFRLYEA